MERKPHYYEKDLETALIEHLQQFLLDLGNGFSFVVRPTLLFIIPAGLSARGGFIRPWRIYPPEAE